MGYPAFSIQHSAFHYGYRPDQIDSATPAVSVITPYYNTGALFFETVDSLLRQSLQQWEWLIVNDGSDDVRALLPLRSADARVRVIDRPHAGVSAARNAGAAQARAPLLFFLDSDDLLAPTALEKLAWTLHARPESAFAGGWSATFGHERIAWPRGFDTRYAFLYENMAVSQSMVRRSVWQQVGGFDEQRRAGLEDYEFWLRCAAHGLWGHDLHEFLIWNRRKPPAAYTSYRWEFRDNPQVLAPFRREMQARYPALFRQGLPRLRVAAGLLDTHAIIPTTLPFANRLQRPASQRRVLLLLPWLQIGGADRFALDLVAGLQARGDRVSVCLLRSAPSPALVELEHHASDVFNLHTFLRPADYPRFLQYLIDSRQIGTVLIANSLLAYQLLPYLRSRCPQVAFTDYLHAEEPWRNGGMPRASVEHDGLLELHITASQHLRQWMIEQGAAAERSEVCPVNVDVQCWQPDAQLRQQVRAELGLQPGERLVLFVGRLAPEKRPLLVAELARRLGDLPCRFVLAGDGELRGSLVRTLRRYQLGGRVQLLGAVGHERVRGLLAACDLLLLPSEREGIALILYEALAMGVVPVAADVGGQRELVTPECGVLVASGIGELDGYEAALRRLLANDELRATMGRVGRERVATHFRADQMLDRMRLLLGRAGERPRPAVNPAAGLAAATLAIEHHQFEERLRALAPVRAVLRLRASPARGLVAALGGLSAALERLDRTLYALRRGTITWLRWARGGFSG